MFYLDGIADKEVTGIERQPEQIIVTFEDDTSHTFFTRRMGETYSASTRPLR